jgi:NodT family efflux transporter outer membrane factor (OMF) lipoprotein
MKKPVFIFLLGAALSGCAVGPDYKRPAPLVDQQPPKTFSDRSTNVVSWKVAQPAANAPRGPWWELFGDDNLNQLEKQAAAHNQDLAAAAANYEQARVLIGAARSAFYPQLYAGGTPGGDINRQRTSMNVPLEGAAANETHTYDTFTAPVYLSWELDFWGRVRRTSESAQAQSAAAADDLETVRLEVATEVASEYFTYETSLAEEALIRDTIQAYQKSLDLTQNRRKGGVVSDLDVAEAATQLHSAEGQLPEIELSAAQNLHALAVLCGQSPVDFTMATNQSTTNFLAALPSIIPGELLERRPDIAAAERRVASANAGIGIAKAAFFPVVKMNGLAGFQSIGIDSLFDWPSRFWSVGPSIDLPLFTGGYNRAHYAAAKAAMDASVATYRQTVLTAYSDVENALAAQTLLVKQWDAETAALIAARQALDIANNRYHSGLVTYLEVATAQTTALSQEELVLRLDNSRQAASINLIKALGGDWKK